MSNGTTQVPGWVKVWLIVLTVIALWSVWWAWRASNWSERMVHSVVDRVDHFETAFETHTHGIAQGATQTDPAGPITWPVEPWPPDELQFP